MKKSDIRKFQEGSAELVVAHAKWQKSRGKMPSMPYHEEQNPLKALALAIFVLTAKGWNWKDTTYVWDIDWDDPKEIVIQLHKNKPPIRVPWNWLTIKVEPDFGQDPKVQPWYEVKTKILWWNSAWEAKNAQAVKDKRLAAQKPEQSKNQEVIETFWNPNGIRGGKRGCWQARLQKKPGIIDAGTSEDYAVCNLLVTVSTFGMSNNRKDYKVIRRPGWGYRPGLVAAHD